MHKRAKTKVLTPFSAVCVQPGYLTLHAGYGEVRVRTRGTTTPVGGSCYLNEGDILTWTALPEFNLEGQADWRLHLS